MDFKERATEILSKHLAEWESNPKRMENGYQYESTYAEMIKKVEQEILQVSVGDVPKSKNVKKKLHTRFGQIEISKSHILSICPSSMSISSLAQETMCYMGQYLVFSEASEVIQTLTGCGVNAKQIERVCHQYGQWIEDEDNQAIKDQTYKEYEVKKANDLHYVSVDGAMYLTREESWKESKLGRIYQPESLVQTSKNRTLLTASDYVTHLGEHKDFIKKMDYCLENLNSLVFIADGARWIWKWADQTYPESIQIVDFYHSKEHLCDFSKLYFKVEKQRHIWIDKLAEMMLAKGISPVIKEIEKLPKQHKTTGKRNELLNYYKRNEKRMQYHDYLEKGVLIGSGAIESAHKDVLQQRLKLSGQRWTMQGFQQMAQLRVVYKSKQEHRIRNLCQKAA